jgi:hypothetical protein
LNVGVICVIPEYGTGAMTAVMGGMVSQSALPVVPAMCVHCGYQFLFNAVKLGIIQPRM